ncbi:MAG: LysM peptidoglycan-binding domain-containing protein, partial [Pseudomonadota bacterium]
RYDPTRATYAAAKYFRNSVDTLSTVAFEHGYTVVARDLNPFVITSYNYGVRGMSRAIAQVGLDYERLLSEYKSPNFQIAVKNFYASFLAARHVAKNQDKFFSTISADLSQRVHSFNVVKLKRDTSAKRLIKELRLDKETFEKLNPAFKTVIWKHKALIPRDYAIRLPYLDTGWDAALTQLDKLPQEIEKPGYVWHRVRSGESACGIAEKYRASCRALIKLNRLNKRATIYAGKRIKVPTKTGGIELAATGQQDYSVSGQSYAQYRVRPGDTACGIANRHQMTCRELLAINGLNTSSIIRTGQALRVSGEQDWHVVTRGQTACGIAEIYRVGCSVLLRANQLNRTAKIYVGQRLRVPRKT